MRGIIQRRIHLHDVKNRENGIVHYQIAEINQPDGQSESIRIGDNGLFFGRGTGNPPLYIGMILDIFTKGEPNKPYFLVRWFYRASEIPIMEDYAYDVSNLYVYIGYLKRSNQTNSGGGGASGMIFFVV